MAFLMNEARYSSLATFRPETAKELFARNLDAAKKRYARLTKLKAIYNDK